MLKRLFLVGTLMFAIGCGDNEKAPRPDAGWEVLPPPVDVLVLVLADSALPDAEVVPEPDAEVLELDAGVVEVDACVDRHSDTEGSGHEENLGNPGHYCL
jgi:hypothetical protein